MRGLEELRVNLLLKENSYVSNIILHRSLILELKFYKLYVLICIMISSLVKRVLLYNNIILITAEVLRFLVHQCVLSFCCHFQYDLLPLLTSRLSDQSINAILGSCK